MCANNLAGTGAQHWSQNGEREISLPQQALTYFLLVCSSRLWHLSYEINTTEAMCLSAGQGLSLDASRCVKSRAYSMIIEASLTNVDGWRRVLFSKGWGDK